MPPALQRNSDMAKISRPSASRSHHRPDRAGAALRADFDHNKFENVHQVGGIQTALMDHPGLGGTSGGGCRVAQFNTGSGLRFTVALDRGGDIVDAFFNQHSLAYLTPNGLVPQSHAFRAGLEWLIGWPGGLVTTCGPQYIGAPRMEDGVQTTLHGNHSNIPAAVETILNPDPRRGRYEMLLSMVLRDSRMFGPVVEVRRQITCLLGQPEILLCDQVTNLGNTRVAHHWLYHVNLGYPLLDAGARFVYRGKAEFWQTAPSPGDGATRQHLSNTALRRFKIAPEPLPEHSGAGERGLIVDIEPDRDGVAHVGLVNERLGLGFELSYPLEQLPRFANWQHFGPAGSYVTGVEPFSGSLQGKAKDKHPSAEQYLEPGQVRQYQVRLRALSTAGEIKDLLRFDGPIKG